MLTHLDLKLVELDSRTAPPGAERVRRRESRAKTNGVKARPAG